MAKRTPAAPGHTEIEASALGVLARLAAKGAYAEPGGDNGAFVLRSPRDADGEKQARAPDEVVAWARSRGWLAHEPGSDRLRIAPPGVEALRRVRCGPSKLGAAQAPAHPARARKAGAKSGALPRTAPEGTLAWLRRRRDKDGQPLITEPQFAAGERLAADFFHAQLTPRVTANWSGLVAGRRTRRAAPGAGVDLSDHVVAARQRISRALSAVGPELADILLDVCCMDVGLEAAERAQAWPARAGKVVLQLALTGLARHYGLLPPEPSRAARRLRHWGDDDYRPGLDAWR
jgi:hypothetical protein